jgi:hypothetical protein
MEKPTRMPQIYGYLVCLISVITFLICVSTLISAISDLGDPIHSGYTPAGSPSLASYANYKMDILKSGSKDPESGKAAYLPDEETLRAMYEAAKNDKIQYVEHEAHRTIVIDGILIVVCVALFLTHWTWMRKIGRAEASRV